MINRIFIKNFKFAFAGSVLFPVAGTVFGAVVGSIVGFFGGVGAGGAIITTKVTPRICTKDIEQLLLNRDLGIIENDDKKTILKEVQMLNKVLDISDLEIKDKNNFGAKIVATSSSPYSTDSFVDVRYLIASNLFNTSALLNNWTVQYYKTVNEILFQLQLPKHFSHSNDAKQQITRIGDKQSQIRTVLIDLRQSIENIQHDDYIHKLYNRVDSLKNDLDELKAIVERAENYEECSKVSIYFDKTKSGTNDFENIRKSFKIVSDFTPQSGKYVPVVSLIFDRFSVLNSINCYLKTLE